MEHNIGVGVIVGLTFASSVFVWSSDNFNKVQKTVLLICAIFPPAQWLGILIVLVYNNFKSNNTVEKIQERKTEETKTKLNSSISDLKELKQKGLISEQEYKTKVDRIEAEKEEQNLKNSTEYKQLKSLFENGVLTKEEFENKIQLLQKTLIKNTKSDKLDIVQDYVEIKKQTEKNIINNKKSSGDTTIVISFIALLLVGMIIFIIYRDEIIPAPITYENEPYPTYQENDYEPIYQEPQKIKKFAYIVISVTYPKLEAYDIGGLPDPLTGFSKPIEYYCYVVWKNNGYLSDIIEIENYNEDIKYMYLDKVENEVRDKLYYVDNSFSTSLFTECRNSDKREEIEKEDYKSKVTDRQIFTFDTYSEASISKEKATIDKQ